MTESKKGDVYRNENLEAGNSSDNPKKNSTENKKKNKGKKGSDGTITHTNTSTGGYGSSQRSEERNVGPLEADLNELPSKRRNSGKNQTGSGLG